MKKKNKVDGLKVMDRNNGELIIKDLKLRSKSMILFNFNCRSKSNDKMYFFFFFFKQKTAYDITHSDWSSDVCSSDLVATELGLEFTEDGVGEVVGFELAAV